MRFNTIDYYIASMQQLRAKFVLDRWPKCQRCPGLARNESAWIARIELPLEPLPPVGYRVRDSRNYHGESRLWTAKFYQFYRRETERQAREREREREAWEKVKNTRKARVDPIEKSKRDHLSSRAPKTSARSRGIHVAVFSNKPRANITKDIAQTFSACSRNHADP